MTPSGRISQWAATALALLLVATFAAAQATGSRARLSSSGGAASGFTFTTYSLAADAVSILVNKALYLDGVVRGTGILFDGTDIRVLGAAPVTPNVDQGINFGKPAVRWSNSYIFTMNTWDPIVYSDFVDDSATTGNRTVNASRGFSAIAAAATSITITNSKVTTSTQVIATVMTNDATATLKNCVPASGSFTCTFAAATGTTKIAWTLAK